MELVQSTEGVRNETLIRFLEDFINVNAHHGNIISTTQFSSLTPRSHLQNGYLLPIPIEVVDISEQFPMSAIQFHKTFSLLDLTLPKLTRRIVCFSPRNQQIFCTDTTLFF